MSGKAQAEIERAVEEAQWYNYEWADFVAEAKELWAALLEDEARRVRREAP